MRTNVGVPTKSARQRGYTWQWEKARAVFLRSNPVCGMCQEHGLLTPAAVVDHIRPHRGDQALFWDETNWQSLCTACHNGHKQALEKSGRVRGCDASGVPLDHGHPWARR